MTVRFFILQTHYRSTLDFSNEALLAAEKGLRRLMDAYEWLQQWNVTETPINGVTQNEALNKKVLDLLGEFEAFINDDFSTAKVLANMFELVPVINSIKDKNIAAAALPLSTPTLLKRQLKVYVEDIMGLKSENGEEAAKL